MAVMPMDALKPILESSGKLHDTGGIVIPTIMVFDSDGDLMGIHTDSVDSLMEELRADGLAPLPDASARIQLAEFVQQLEPPPAKNLVDGSHDLTIVVVLVQGVRGLCQHCPAVVPDIRQGLDNIGATGVVMDVELRAFP